MSQERAAPSAVARRAPPLANWTSLELGSTLRCVSPAKGRADDVDRTPYPEANPPIDCQINHLSFTWSRRSFWPFFGAAKKRILNDVSAYFPAGEVSAIIVRPSLLSYSASVNTTHLPCALYSRVPVVLANQRSFSFSPIAR